jgi:autotransporter-associated beta strand protein
LIKSGPGTMELTVIPSYPGGTVVSQGTLVVPGLPSGFVDVAAGATLVASGTIGPVNSAGSLVPVPGIGMLTVNGPLTLSGTLAVEVDGTSNDQIDVFGELSLTGSTVTVTRLAPGFTSGVIAIANSINGLPTAPAGYALSVQPGAIASTEELVLTATGEPVNDFASWLAANAPGQGPADDHDSDGAPNAVEYFMGENGSGFTPLPQVVNGKVTWPKDPAAIASYVVKTSTDLVDWVPAAGGVNDTGTAVEFTLPAGEDRLFTRLEVSIP